MYVRPGLVGDLLQHRRGEHLRPEDRRHLLGLDLVDEGRDLRRGRLGEVAGLDRPDHVPAVALPDVGVGVVVGHELDPTGHAGLVGLEGIGQGRGLGQEGLQVRVVGGGVVRVELGELLGHDRGVLPGEDRVGPQVRVGLAVVLGEGEVVDVLRLRAAPWCRPPRSRSPGACWPAASSSVGSSSLRPLTRIRSASLSRPATLGSGSNVWLLVPSGTMPWTSTRSPPMLAAIEVIGETVVATRSLSPFPPCAESSDWLHPVRRSPTAKADRDDPHGWSLPGRPGWTSHGEA